MTSTNASPSIKQLFDYYAGGVYRFAVPLTKSYTTVERGETKYVMEGIASDESTDQQGETLIQKGMQFGALLEYGFVNWDHQLGPENLIGEPWHAEIIPGPKFFTRSSMYVEDKARAKEAWDLAQALAKSGRRQLGWSVEGAILQRDPVNKHRILTSEVRHLALTHQPVNANTWATIAKSMTVANTQVLQLENIEKQIVNVLWGPCKPDRLCFDDQGRFYGGRGGMFSHLIKCRGADAGSAERLMKRLIDSLR